ncbi:MAG: response regulator [Oligoflexales bacterium]
MDMSYSEPASVLLVDDNPANLLSLEGLLEAGNLNLVRALSGEEALEKALELKPALILLDVQMPGMDGFEVAQLLRKKERTREIPIIFVTATHREEKFTFQGFESGAVDYLFKPLNALIVRSKVNVFVELYRSRMRLESALLELSAINRELKAFAYSVSHDLKTPVRGISWVCNSLLEDQSLSPQVVDLIKHIRTASNSMNAMVDGFLSLAKVTQYSMRPSKIDLSALCRQIWDEIQKETPARSVLIEIQDGMQITGDQVLVESAMRNLLRNAWKYTAKAAQPNVKVGLKRSDEEEVFYVSDNGVGFDMNQAKQLFTPFHRLHSAKEFEGTGIGLATVQRIVHRHGGNLWADGENGKGACFYFTLKGRNGEPS